MPESLPLPKEIWDRTPQEAQALILLLIERVRATTIIDGVLIERIDG